MPYHTGTFFLSVNVSDFISTVSWDWFKKPKKKKNQTTESDLIMHASECVFWN